VRVVVVELTVVVAQVLLLVAIRLALLVLVEAG
jgi:hypothetical protein